MCSFGPKQLKVRSRDTKTIQLTQQIVQQYITGWVGLYVGAWVDVPAYMHDVCVGGCVSCVCGYVWGRGEGSQCGVFVRVLYVRVNTVGRWCKC